MNKLILIALFAFFGSTPLFAAAHPWADLARAYTVVSINGVPVTDQHCKEAYITSEISPPLTDMSGRTTYTGLSIILLNYRAEGKSCTAHSGDEFEWRLPILNEIGSFARTDSTTRSYSMKGQFKEGGEPWSADERVTVIEHPDGIVELHILWFGAKHVDWVLKK